MNFSLVLTDTIVGLTRVKLKLKVNIKMLISSWEVFIIVVSKNTYTVYTQSVNT